MKLIFFKEAENQEKLEKKWDDSSIQVKDYPTDSAYAKEIWQYLKQGKTITRYLHPIWAEGSVIDEDELHYATHCNQPNCERSAIH
jgi:hypothetical protein